MGYGSYRSYRHRNWGFNPPSKYSKLQGMFGAAVGEVKQQFFELDSEAMSELLSEYGIIYGKSAETYARSTVEKWKSESTKLSGQTMERLIELVPPYLSANQRLVILKLILARHERLSVTRTIKIDMKEPASGLSEVDAALQEIRVTDELAYLPAHVMAAAKWLYGDDITVARAVIISIADTETKRLKESAEREINLLKRTLQSGQIKAATYTVNTPGGNLSIVAYTPSLCFVATVCFGKDSVKTQTFRAWRDKTLLNYETGRHFVVWYYTNGEQLSRFIKGNRLLLATTRSILTILESLVRAAYGEPKSEEL